MRNLICLLAVAAFLVLDWSASATEQARKKTPVKKTSTAHRKTSSRKKSSSKRRTATTWRNRQLTPTPERYREIQNALVAKGYLSGEDANGTWGPSSVEALKRFQAEQKIDANGKINSLSLIALGLGPKHEPAAVPPAGPPQAPQDQ